MEQKVEEASKYIQNLCSEKPDIAVILGSGLGSFCEGLKDFTEIPYEDIPHFPVSTVEGHAGKFLLTKKHGKTLAIMSGRFHYYEGYSFPQVVFPIRVLAELGVKKLLVTNAAGAVNEKYKPGDLMIISDHINFMGGNPLMGANVKKWGVRFPDMSKTYTPSLRKLAHEIGERIKLSLQEGVYMAMTGPSFETPAEIRAARVLGADAVGMSTVPEAIVARHMGLQILGLSCITNMAAGILDQPLTHEETKETADSVRDKFVNLVNGIIEKM